MKQLQIEIGVKCVDGKVEEIFVKNGGFEGSIRLTPENPLHTLPQLISAQIIQGVSSIALDALNRLAVEAFAVKERIEGAEKDKVEEEVIDEKLLN